MTNIFLCFSNQDERFASRLANDLEKAGVSVYTDRHSENGNRRFDHIKEMLQNCNAVVPIISVYFLQSQQRRNELRFANEIGCRIIPIALTPIPHEIIADATGTRIHIIFSDWRSRRVYRRGLQTLLTSLYNNHAMHKELPRGEGIDRPDYEAILPEPESNTDVPSDHCPPAVEVALDRYKQANWWYWDQEMWDIYLAQRHARQGQNGTKFEEHRNERVLVEFGNWIVLHKDATEYQRVFMIRNLTSKYIGFWQFGIEPPPDLPMPDWSK